MIEHRIDIVNLPQVSGGLLNIERELGLLKPLWQQFGSEFYRQETDHFAVEPWVALSPSYAEWKRQEFGDKPILRATDALFRSLTQEGAEGNVHRVNDLDAEFGSSDFKAMLHFKGTAIMPARNPMADPNIDRYTTIAGEYLDGLVRKAGFN